MVQLRIYTYDQWGNEIVTPWAFNALDDQDEYESSRESETSATGEPRRRPFSEREVRVLTLGAGLLIKDSAWTAFKRLLRAHKIEWQRPVGGKLTWVQFTLDEQPRVTFERQDDISRLRRKKITLIQSKALSFTDFENTKKQLSDSIT